MIVKFIFSSVFDLSIVNQTYGKNSSSLAFVRGLLEKPSQRKYYEFLKAVASTFKIFVDKVTTVPPTCHQRR